MHTRFKILFFLIIAISSIAFSQQYWLKIGSFTNSELNLCSFTDTLNGWAAGDSGIIIHTTNGGYNWSYQNSHISEPIRAMQFINKRLGWAIATTLTPEFWGTIILKTTNGGQNWDSSRYYEENVFINSIYFLDSATGYMGNGNPGGIYKTTNAGLNWFTCFIDTSNVYGKFSIYKFRFLNYNFGFACGGKYDIAGVIWKTTNGGNYWTADAISYEPNFDLKIFDYSHIITVGGDYEYGASLTTTINGGANWIWQSLEIMGIPRDLEFRTESEGWMPLGYTPAFLKTNDKGSKWLLINTPDSSQMFDISFVNSNFGICVGANGTVLKFNPSAIGIGINDKTSPESVTLFQNYPNPFNPQTKISYEIIDKSLVDLKVYNLIGQQVELLHYGIKSPGIYTTNFSGENLPSGIYFYRLCVVSLESGLEKYITKKMVLLK